MGIPVVCSLAGGPTDDVGSVGDALVHSFADCATGFDCCPLEGANGIVQVERLLERRHLLTLCIICFRVEIFEGGGVLHVVLGDRGGDDRDIVYAWAGLGVVPVGDNYITEFDGTCAGVEVTTPITIDEQSRVIVGIEGGTSTSVYWFLLGALPVLRNFRAPGVRRRLPPI
jgi:hypothetical protein